MDLVGALLDHNLMPNLNFLWMPLFKLYIYSGERKKILVNLYKILRKKISLKMIIVTL